MDSIPSVLFAAELTQDDSFTFTYGNQRLQAYFGVTAAQLTHNPECVLQCLSASHRQAFMACITRAIRQQIPSECECEVTLDQQPARWLLVQIAPSLSPHGVTASGVMCDISASYADKQSAFIREQSALIREQQALTDKQNALNSANFFMHLQDSLPDNFYYKDQHSVYLGGNKAWYTHHGYASLSAIVGKSDADSKALSPAIKREILAQEQEMMRTGIPIHKTEHYIDSNGKEFFTDSKKTPLYDEQGKIIGLVGITRDISEQVKTANALEKAREESLIQKITTDVLEAALRESSALLGALNMHAIVSISNADGAIIEVNDAFCDISGYSRAELLGQSHNLVNSQVHPRQFWVDMWSDIAHGKPWRKPVCNRAKDGSLYWVDTFIAPFMNSHGTIEKYISIRTDITAAKLQEAKLRTARDQLKKAADVAEMGIWIWDITTDQFVWNERMRKIYETPISVCDAGKHYAHWRSRVHPEDIAFTEALLTKALAGKAVYNPTFRIITSQGNIRYIQAAGLVEYDQAGNAIQMMGINRDITQQYETEDVLRKAKQAADAASRAKSDFLANMSHELRTPMNAILGMLSLLKKTELNPRQVDYAQKTESAARSLLGLLNDILDLSKAEAGKIVLDPHPFALSQVLRDLSVILSTSVGAKPVEVLFDIATDVPNDLVGDAMRLQQVLLNLASNAIKFTERGEVVLRIDEVKKSATATTLTFSVRDTGIGIAPENQARIFSGFTQAEASTTRRFGGTGLGVAISQRLVNLMGGQLELVSALGEGSRFFFTITLPLAAHAPQQLPARLLSTNTASWPVLVVDDNPTALEIIARQCESLGWLVDTAVSGAQALALIQQQTDNNSGYRAVFVDWQMPDMDGWQTSSAIRKLALDQVAPVVVMVTAHDREMLAELSDAEQALLDGFLVKPVTASMLLDAVVDANIRTKGQPWHLPEQAADEPRLVGMKILLTEDNLNNQQVARELLEAEGAHVEVANNGQEAVTRLAQSPAADLVAFDVVLMDLQMPVMDGFTATQHIRKDVGLVDLPIIAMTANVMASDKAACLNAGMNDHIGKPFDLNNLVDLLRLHVGWKSLNAPTHEPPTTSSNHYDTAATAANVDVAAALARLGGRQELYVRMFPMFLGSVSELPHKLADCLEAHDYKQASQHLHSLKGLAGTMGAMHMATQAGLAEKRLSGDIPAAEARLQISNINALIGESLPHLKALLIALQPPVVVPEATTEAAVHTNNLYEPALLHSLESLLVQLRNSDMAATNASVQVQEKFGAALGKHWEPLSAAISCLDFEQATDCVLALMAFIQSNRAKGND